MFSLKIFSIFPVSGSNTSITRPPGTKIRPAVVALIGSAGISILQTAFWEVSGKMVISDTSWLMVGIFVVCVILLRKVKMNPIWVMVLAGVMKVLVAVAGKI